MSNAREPCQACPFLLDDTPADLAGGAPAIVLYAAMAELVDALA